MGGRDKTGLKLLVLATVALIGVALFWLWGGWEKLIPWKAAAPARSTLVLSGVRLDQGTEGAQYRIVVKNDGPQAIVSLPGAAYRNPQVLLVSSDLSTASPRGSYWSPGAEQVFVGKVEIEGHTLDGDAAYPLALKLVKDAGLVYLCGRGVVTGKDGVTHRLGQEDTLDTWLPLLASKEQLEREGTAQALGWLASDPSQKKRAVRALVAALQDVSFQVRRDAAESLGRLGDQAAAEPLWRALGDKHDWVADVAAESLGRGIAAGLNQVAIAQLTAQLKSEDSGIRRRACMVLGGMQNSRTIPLLLGALADRETRVRVAAVGALERLGDPRAVQPLRDLLSREHDESLKEALQRAVKKLGG